MGFAIAKADGIHREKNATIPRRDGASTTTGASASRTVQPTIVPLPPAGSATSPANTQEDEGEWAGTDLAAATDGISNFSIGDLDDDDDDL